MNANAHALAIVISATPRSLRVTVARDLDGRPDPQFITAEVAVHEHFNIVGYETKVSSPAPGAQSPRAARLRARIMEVAAEIGLWLEEGLAVPDDVTLPELAVWFTNEQMSDLDLDNVTVVETSVVFSKEDRRLFINGDWTKE